MKKGSYNFIIILLILANLVIVFTLTENQDNETEIDGRYFILEGKTSKIEINDCELLISPDKYKIGGGTFVYTGDEEHLKDVDYYSKEIILVNKLDTSKKMVLFNGSVSSNVKGQTGLQKNIKMNIGSIEGDTDEILRFDVLDHNDIIFVLRYGGNNGQFIEERVKLEYREIDLSFFNKES